MSQKVKFTFILSILIVLFIILNNNAIAQGSNNGIFFQAVARDNFSNPAKDRKIYIESSIIQYTATGTKVLIEQHEANTDETGVFNISLGNGKRTGGSATNLTNIDWAMGPYFLSLKIAITPRAPIPSWDYTKEWIDLGATPFGTVPYALYAGSAAGLNDKLSISDTSSMLAIYAKVQAIKSLETNVNTKIASTDTAAMLAPYKKMVNELIASNITSLTADMINNALDSKVNLIDSNNLYVTPSQLAAKTFDISPINKSIATKLSLADSINRYITPTQLAASIFDPTEIINYIATKADSSKMTVLLNQKANASDISNSLSNKVNLADSNSKYVTPSQLAAKTFDISPINISIANKLNLADSNSKYVTPSQLAAKTFDTSPINISIANKLNLADSNSKYVTPTQLAAKTFDISPINISIANKLNLADSNSKYVTPTQLAGNKFDPTGITNNLISKVDKISGKGLSSNDYTNAEKAKLATTSGTNTGDQDLTSLATFSSLNLKLNSSDTAAMLSDRFKRDTIALSNRINLKANSIEVVNNLALKANSLDVTNSLALKANSTDVANDLALKANSTDVTNDLNLKLNSSDTSAMLSDRFKRDTIALSNRINLKANSIDVVNNLALKANSTDVTNSLALKANSLDVTNSLALKANNTDVSNELALKQATITAGTTSQFYRGDKTWQTISYSTIGAAPSAGSSSINSVGTITSGVWNGTAIAVANGGTGVTTLSANGILIGNGTSAVTTVAPSTNGNVLTSNGTSWISSTPSVSLIREVANEFTATTAQTSFTLTQTPSVNSKVKMYINGVRISNTAYSVSGVTLTYNGTYNGAYSLTTGDRIQFDYYY
jgi:ribosomal protein S25